MCQYGCHVWTLCQFSAAQAIARLFRATGALLHPASVDALRGWPVSTRGNRPANNDADLLAPLPPA